MNGESITVELTWDEWRTLYYELDELIIAKEGAVKHAVNPEHVKRDLDVLRRVLEKLEVKR